MRPGNRATPAPTLTGRPGNRLPGALYSPLVGLARDAAAQVEQVSADAAIAADVTTLETVTSGLDVPDITAKLADFEDRISDLEGP